MALAAGTRLGPYEVLGLIGAGGMGEVYRAKDTRLDRSVAIKLLPADLAADTDRRARFEREARTISTLNHPHICVLYDVGDREGVPYLVMEHLAGETLAERLKKGPLPLDQVLDLGAQIADALSAAHKAGIVHRDLKPGNVMLTKTGVKLLDFGLAKLAGHGERPAVAPDTVAATESESLTGRGTILGTLPYMAPEQLEGKPADARTDLWALGTLLYEMVTGQRAFEGTSSVSLMGQIMNAEPPALVARQPLTPPALERLVKRCLAKDPDQRWESAHDIADELRWISTAGGQTAASRLGSLTVGVERGSSRPRAWWLGLAIAAVAAAAGGTLTWRLRPASPPRPLAHLSVAVRPADALDAMWGFSFAPGGGWTSFGWTPDGQALVFVGQQGKVRQLYVRRLDAAEARPLPNTEGARLPTVSADGAWVTFWSRGVIRRVPLAGGLAVDLASGVVPVARIGSAVMPPWGMACNADGAVFMGGAGQPIWVIPGEGPPRAVSKLEDGEVSHGLPWVLPDGQTLLYTVRKRRVSWGDEEVVAQTLATGARKTLLRDAADARYVPTGHLVFLRRGVLFAVAFDVRRLEVRGTPVPVLDGVAQSLTGANSICLTGAGQFAIAPTGTLAWVPSPVIPYPDSTLVTVDRQGRVSPLGAPVRSYDGSLRLAPDGHRLAVTIGTLTEVGLWVYDLGRGTLVPVNRGEEVGAPRWSPDGQRLVFPWLAKGHSSLAVQPPDGTTPASLIAAGGPAPSSFTPDGRQLAAVANAADIVTVTLGPGTPTVQPLIQTPNLEEWPEVSPDGHWLAYGSDVSGRFQVYVQPYPGPGATEPVSLDGGWSPSWRPDGREIFFTTPPDAAGNRWMMAATFGAGPPLRVGRPRVLFEFTSRRLAMNCDAVRCYDVAPDGQHFYAVQEIEAEGPPPQPLVTHINVIQNWFEELKAKVPTTR